MAQSFSLSTIQGSGVAAWGLVTSLATAAAPVLGLVGTASPSLLGALAAGLVMILLKECPRAGGLLGEVATLGETLGEATGNTEIKAVAATVQATVVAEASH